MDTVTLEELLNEPDIKEISIDLIWYYLIRIRNRLNEDNRKNKLTQNEFKFLDKIFFSVIHSSDILNLYINLFGLDGSNDSKSTLFGFYQNNQLTWQRPKIFEALTLIESDDVVDFLIRSAPEHVNSGNSLAKLMNMNHPRLLKYAKSILESDYPVRFKIEIIDNINTQLGDELIKLLKEQYTSVSVESTDIKVHAILTLGKIRNQDLTNFFSSVIHDTESLPLQKAAIEALGRDGSKRAIHILFNTYTYFCQNHKQNLVLCSTILEALGKTNNPAAVLILVQIFENTTLEYESSLIIGSLFLIDSSVSQGALESILEDVEVSFSLVKYLADLGKKDLRFLEIIQRLNFEQLSHTQIVALSEFVFTVNHPLAIELLEKLYTNLDELDESERDNINRKIGIVRNKVITQEEDVVKELVERREGIFVTGHSRELYENILQKPIEIVETMQQEYPNFVGVTIVGSMSLGYWMPPSDLDYCLIFNESDKVQREDINEIRDNFAKKVRQAGIIPCKGVNYVFNPNDNLDMERYSLLFRGEFFGDRSRLKKVRSRSIDKTDVQTWNRIRDSITRFQFQTNLSKFRDRFGLSKEEIEKVKRLKTILWHPPSLQIMQQEYGLTS